MKFSIHKKKVTYNYNFVYFNLSVYKCTNLQNEHKTLLCDDNFEPVNGGNVWGYTCLANLLLL